MAEHLERGKKDQIKEFIESCVDVVSKVMLLGSIRVNLTLLYAYHVVRTSFDACLHADEEDQFPALKQGMFSTQFVRRCFNPKYIDSGIPQNVLDKTECLQPICNRYGTYQIGVQWPIKHAVDQYATNSFKHLIGNWEKILDGTVEAYAQSQGLDSNAQSMKNVRACILDPNHISSMTLPADDRTFVEYHRKFFWTLGYGNQCCH